MDDELNRAIQMSMEESHQPTGRPQSPLVDLSGETDADDETAQAIAMSLGGDSAAAAEADSRPTDEEIRAHWESVVGGSAESIKNKPLVGPLEGLDEIKKEYAEGSPIFAQKLDTLSAKYSGVRRARNDGNCAPPTAPCPRSTRSY
jgi:hypothetical protein